jgi:hypothetical protein
MSLCTTCGRPRTETAPFCAGCGARFADAADTAKPADADLTRLEGVHSGPVPPSPGAFGPPSPGVFEPPSPRRGRAAIGIALVIVAVFAVGGGTFALVSALTAHKSAGQPAARSGSTVPVSSSAASATPASPSSPRGTVSPVAPAGATVVVAPAAAGNPATPGVQALLKRYFAAINDHDYAAYSALLDPRMRQQNPPSTFASGYATTRDSAETLTAISDAGGGELAAMVSFTSHQSPADSIDNSSCTAWTITLYLRPQGSGYLIGTPPAGYKPTHQNCP